MVEGSKVENLGWAAQSISISGACRVNDAIYVGTRGINPAKVAKLNLINKTVEKEYTVPKVRGIRGVVEYNGTIYFGTYEPAALCQLDPEKEKVTELAKFESEKFVWDVTAVDGCVYAGTYPNATIREYDIEKNQSNSLGSPQEDVEYVRSLAAKEDTIYAGVGPPAQVVAIDRVTGEKQSILPSELRDNIMSYEIEATEDLILVRLTPDGILSAISQRNPSAFEVIDRNVSTFDVDEGTVYTFKNGIVKQYDDDWRAKSVGAGVDNFEPFWLSATDDTILGANSDGSIWSLGGHQDEIQLTNAEMTPGAERPQSIVALESDIFVTSHGTIHRYGANNDVETREIPGEGKAMAVADGLLYIATYPNASVLRYNPYTDELRVIGEIGELQNRSRTIHYNEDNDTLYVGTRPNYGHIGGAVVVVNRTTEDIDVNRHVIENQSITAIANDSENIYIGSEIHGGLGTDPIASKPQLIATDPSTQSTAWKLSPVGETQGISALVNLNRKLYGTTADGDLFVVDSDAPKVIHRGTVTNGWTALTTYEGAIYGLSKEELVKIDPETYDVTTILDNLGGKWYGNPRITIDKDSNIYALSDYNLVKVDIG